MDRWKAHAILAASSPKPVLGFGQENLRKFAQSFQIFEFMVTKTCCVNVLALCVAVLAGALQDGVGSLPHQSWSTPACQGFSGVSENF